MQTLLYVGGGRQKSPICAEAAEDCAIDRSLARLKPKQPAKGLVMERYSGITPFVLPLLGLGAALDISLQLSPSSRVVEASKYLFRFKLTPSNRRSETLKLPLPVDPPVKLFDHGVSMAFILHQPSIRCRVALVGSLQLMVPDSFFLRHLFPFRCTNVVLCMNKRIAYEPHVAHDAHEMFRRHGFPFVSVDFGVVDLPRFLH